MAPSEERRYGPNLPPVEIFCSYASKDEPLCRELERHLSLLSRQGIATLWYDRCIAPGMDWSQAIDTHLETASLLLLLVSADFLASNYCYGIEMQRALQRHEANEAYVIPILLRDCDWRSAPFASLQVLPRDAKPIVKLRHRDTAWTNVVTNIRQILNERSQPATAVPENAQALPKTVDESPTQSERQIPQALATAALLKIEQRSGSEEGAPFEERKTALIVGVNNTRRSSLLPDLKYAEGDAHEIAYVLRSSACNFTCLQTALTGEKAEMQAVRRAVIKLAQQKSAQDLLLFYFLGHALPIRTREGYTDICLVTDDFDEADAIEDATAYLSFRWLQEKLYGIDGAARVLIILDCCYAKKMIHASSDPSDVEVSQFLKECIGPLSVMEQNGRWKIVMTTSTYTTPAEERGITSLFQVALRGDVQKVLDEQGNIYFHTLYSYLQNEMPLAQLPDLPENFPRLCTIATYQEKSRSYLQQLQRSEENAGWNDVSRIRDEIRVIKDVITNPDYFKSLASLNAPFGTQWFDRTRDETVSLADLDQEKISKFFAIPRVQIQDDFSSGLSDMDQLERFGLLQEIYPTHAALLCFGWNPTRRLAGAFTRCTLWRTNDRDQGWLEAQDYRRDLLTQFEASRAFLQKHLHLTRMISEDERLDALEVPLIALEEALANALVHREYAFQTSPVYLDIFPDRVEICSPGDLPEPMTMEALREEHKSHPRNPQIARIFYLYGHVEKVGSGIQRMQNTLKNTRLRPAKLELGKDKTFRVIFNRPQQQGRPLITRRRMLVVGATLVLVAMLLLIGGGYLLAPKPCTQGIASQYSGPPNCVSGRITLDGSTELQHFAGLVADGYISQCPNSQISVQRSDSANGLRELKDNAITIADSDLQAPSALTRLVDHEVVAAVFVVIVNPQIGISNLTSGQLQSIYNGTVTNWKAVGGRDIPIVPYRRSYGSGTRATFDQYILSQHTEGVGEIFDDPQVLIQSVRATEGAIGYASYNDVYTYAPDVEPLLIISIDGTRPNYQRPMDIVQNAYKFWSIEHMYTNGPATGLAKAFLDYMGSNRVAIIAQALFFVPLNQVSSDGLVAHCSL